MELVTPPIKKSRRPTNKWVVARITALAGLLSILLTGDRSITDPEILLMIAFVAEAGTAYFTRKGSAASTELATRTTLRCTKDSCDQRKRR